MDTVNTVLDPAALTPKVLASVFAQPGFGAVLEAGNSSAGEAFYKHLADDKETSETLKSMQLGTLIVMMESAKTRNVAEAMEKLQIALATAIWLGYQLAQAQMAELPAQHS
jgi:hypothetical protein